MLIREPDDDGGHPNEAVGRFGVVVGFIQGGVTVNVTGSGVGLYPPEHLDLQDGQDNDTGTRRS